MTMRTQWFVPCMSPEGVVYGLVAISPAHQYVGTETSVTIGGVVYPTHKVSYTPRAGAKQNIQQPMEFLAITVDRTEWARNYRNRGADVLNQYVGLKQWFSGPMVQYKQELIGELDFFLRGWDKTAVTAPVIPAAPSGNAVSVSWSANSPFANQPFCPFFDIPFEVLGSVTQQDRILKISVGAPSADPGNGLALKAMIAFPANMGNPGGVYGQVRVVRITREAVPTGSYVWPVTVTDVDNQSTTINVSVVVS